MVERQELKKVIKAAPKKSLAKLKQAATRRQLEAGFSDFQDFVGIFAAEWFDSRGHERIVADVSTRKFLE